MQNLTIEIHGRNDVSTDVIKIDKIIQGFIEALYFADTGIDTDIDSNALIAHESLTKIQIECLYFYSRFYYYFDSIIEDHNHYAGNPEHSDTEFYTQLGRDLYFTSAGHGVGFWDREDYYGKTHAKGFTNFCELRYLEIYQGDDNLIYIS